ncbi:alpha-galactosidase [Micromonospora endolithica]|uniref:Alpha-galactosidase n=1 Tax=Micromonospora endolithica TaxID=230091 RepID=A0A3A9YQW6_9ACTN|nr:alpha-galactosidase [Micromonospora endolithica]RKN38408.1 alpha-galactosidase [Micromonospora endolithica]TWJ23179.1 alpha-galactosidase [Micromonospora endolithica]
MTIVHLRRARTSLVLDARGAGLPRVVHWGADLGPVPADDLPALVDATVPPVAPSSFDAPTVLSLLPEAGAGWSGRPALSGHRDGTAWSTAFRLDDLVVEDTAGRSARVTVLARDPDARLSLAVEIELDPAGLLLLRHRLRNDGDGPYALRELTPVLPVPAVATELLDLTGRWCRERSPQRHPFATGTWVREGRHGRTGHDATLLLVAGTAGFGFGHGEVWAVHTAWSGDHVTFAERRPTGDSTLGGGELLAPGEVALAPGGEYATPLLYAGFSDTGLDGLSHVLHTHLRARPHHPSTPRPVTLNVWEAVYFDHDPARLAALADHAAEVGVERFVLDDGWFSGRRHDRAGLGDWFVDTDVWPDGLHPLIDHVTGHGLQFGLWVEPEMVNPDSDVFRAHPDWVLSVPGRLPPQWRHQQVLDVAHPDAYAYLLGRLDALLTEYPGIGYLKWDHNRDLTEAGHHGRPGVHEQTLAVYRLLDELRVRHPGVEIESCASGGGRVDLEILRRTDRVWASDCNDALERLAIQRWTGLLLPPELVGTHIGPERSHTTHRVHDLGFRASTALFGHHGIEWDIGAIGAAERRELAAWVALHKRLRPLLHSGRVVRVDHPDPAVWAHGVVAHDGSRAVYAVARLATSVAQVPGPVRLPGLDPRRRYAVRPAAGVPEPAVQQVTEPGWGSRTTLGGAVLASVGLQMPALHPEQTLLLEVDAVD